MAHKILVVEDDPSAADLLRTGLSQTGDKVVTVESGEEALERIFKSLPDLVILDVGLPGISGLAVCDLLRKDPRSASLPIILLTSRDKEGEKVAGLKTGADDYVTKPFSLPEVKARVAALLRRVERGGRPDNALEVGEIRLDPDSREVLVRGKRIDLRPKEFSVLALFLKKQGQVLSKDVLREAAWGEESIVGSHTIEVTISQLREKMGPLGASIQTVSGIGYRFATK